MEELDKQFDTLLEGILNEFYIDMRWLETHQDADKYDPITTESRRRAILAKAVSKIKGREYEHDAIRDGRTSEL